jgi:glycerate kinase
MRIVAAPNAFKGCLTAIAAADAMTAGVLRAAPGADVVRVPVADGGDGLVDVAIEGLGGEARVVTVCGPRGEPTRAAFCYVPAMKFAAVEMALASGLALLARDRRDPTRTTTRGTGELIRAALDLGVSRIGVGIGGSATNDGGIGMAAALGARFLDDRGAAVEPVGGELGRVRRIDLSGLDPRVTSVRFEAVCDVDNPLCGPTGAAHVYGPQKGATPEQVEALDAGLANLADVIERDLGVDVRDLPGSGAAGGLGAGLRAFLGAELRRGVDLVLELVDLHGKLAGADLVLTGEGQIDFQTAYGKAPAGVGAAARARGIPCIAIAGGVGDGLGDLHAIGIDAVFSLCPGPVTLDEAMTHAAEYLARAAEQAVRAFLAGGAGLD